VDSEVILAGGITNGAINKAGPAPLTLNGRVNLNADSEVRNGTLILAAATVTNSGALRPDCDQANGAARLVVTNGALLSLTVANANFRLGMDGDTNATNFLDIAGTLRLPASTDPNGRLFIGGGNTKGVATLLAGGDLEVRAIEKAGTGLAVMNFNGGTLRPKTNQAAFMQGLDSANVLPGGLFFDSADFDVTIAQPLLNGGGGVTKLGTGTLSLLGSNTFSGTINVNAGRLFLSPAHSASGAVNVSDGAVLGFNLSAGAGAVHVTSAALGGTTGASLEVWGINGNLSAAPFEATNLVVNAPIAISVYGQIGIGQFPLIRYETIGGSGRFYLGNIPPDSVATLVTNNQGTFSTVELNVTTGTQPILWTGLMGGTNNGNWDHAISLNWQAAGTPRAYNQYLLPGDGVRFDDSVTGETNVNLAIVLLPCAISVSNTLTPFTFAGPGKISGATGLTKQGLNSLTVGGTSNDFNGAVSIQAGTLKAGNASALGNSVGGTTVESNGTLDLNGQNLTNELVTVQGTGAGGAGAVVSSSPFTSGFDGLARVILAGDTTFAADNRWDIAHFGQLTGNGYKLTKIGTNMVSLKTLGDTGLGDTSLDGGTLRIENNTMLGAASKTLTISSNSTFSLWNVTNDINKFVVLNGGTIKVDKGTNVVVGSLAINAGLINTIDATAGPLMLSGVISGSGVLTKAGANVLSLAVDNTWSGGLVISVGSLQVGTNGATGSLGSGNVTNNASLALNRSDTAGSYGGTISGSGSVVQFGSGTYTLSGSNTYAGATILSNGTLAIAANNTLPTTTTINFGGRSTFDLQGHSQTVSSISFASVIMTNIITGGPSASLLVNGPTDITFGPASGNGITNTIIMSDLGNFTYSAPTNTFRVGPSGSTANPPPGQAGQATLAGTNTLTASRLYMGENGLGGTGGPTVTNMLHLGQVNTLFVDSILIGSRGGSCLLDFAPNWSSPSLTLRGSNGSLSAVSSVILGNVNNNNAVTLSHIWDTSAGTLDAILGTLVVGQVVSRYGTDNGVFKMGAGSLIVTNIILGQSTGGTNTANGTFTLSGGTMNAGTVVLSDNTFAYNTNRGTFIITNSGILLARSITKGRVTGVSSSSLTLDGTNAVLDLQGGSIGTNGVSTTYIDTLNLLSGTLKDVAEINGGMNLTKTGTGTLILAGTNRYTGATIVNAGVLRVNAGGTVTNTPSISVQGGALIVNGSLGAIDASVTLSSGSLGGQGFVGCSTASVIGGTLAPGEPLGLPSTLTFGGVLTLNPASRTVLILDKTAPQTNDLVRAGIFQLRGTLVVTNLGSISSIQSGDTFKLFEGVITPSFNFTNFILPELNPGLAWNTSAITNNGTLSVVQVDSPPIILTGPQSQTNWAGSNVTFFVVATGTPAPSYQWFFGTNLLTGATSSNLVLSSLILNNAGQYSVLVTNLVGGTNAAATLTVWYLLPAPVVGLTSNAFSFQFVAETNRAYWLEARPDLANGSWVIISGITNAVGATNLLDAAATQSNKFYRIGSQSSN
jgi:autotransporter-associated beta strand protein